MCCGRHRSPYPDPSASLRYGQAAENECPAPCAARTIAVGKAAGERLRQPLGVDPCVHGQARRFREDCHGASDHYLIAEFGGLVCAGRTHMCEPSRHRQNIGPHPFDVGGIASGHDRERAFLGAHTAARDRRIDPSHAVCHLQLRGNGARCIRVDRREVEKAIILYLKQFSYRAPLACNQSLASGGRKFTSCSAEMRTISATSVRLCSWLNSASSFCVGDTQKSARAGLSDLLK